MKKIGLIIELFAFISFGLSGQDIDTIEFYKFCGNEVFIISEQRPQYPGGDEILIKKLNSLNLSEKKSQLIKIYFRVNCNGDAADFRLIKRDKATEVEKQVFEIVSSQKKWEPARQRQNPVNACYFLNIEIKRGKFRVLYPNSGNCINWSNSIFKTNL